MVDGCFIDNLSKKAIKQIPLMGVMKKDITEMFTFIDDFFKCADKFIQSECLPNQKLRIPTCNL